MIMALGGEREIDHIYLFSFAHEGTGFQRNETTR
jgi:hypothetical protein